MSPSRGLLPGLAPPRDSAFIVIYPLGMISEVVLMVSALPYLRERRLHSMAMPNPVNFGFDYASFLTVRGRGPSCRRAVLPESGTAGVLQCG